MGALQGKVAIITGASRGVGEYMAVELAKEGCNIVVAARTEAAGQSRLEGTIAETAAALAKLGVRAVAVRCDVTDDESIESMVRRAVDEFGRIDILINNAGIMAPAKLVDMPLKRWDLLWRVNVRGAIACSRAVLPHMIQRRDGVIINISSIAADQEGAGNISYMLTKHALRELAKGLAAEERENNIRVFALSPLGWVPTPGTLFYRLDETMPSVGPMLERPEAMGRAAVYLCGEDARDLSGQHVYSRHLLRDRVNNGVDLYQGDEAFLAQFK
ncbi:MAG TPA: SDR family NAD(P)-dependent oxidoreductase [Dehalococcoidia bacterium]|nr:SDR family NAD(P)-dependent oxidoreductase [Dehalococcoidia bacterium]